jgi:hypothetical protein
LYFVAIEHGGMVVGVGVVVVVVVVVVVMKRE